MKPDFNPLFKRLKRTDPRVVDSLFHEAHDHVFACTDCLKCANCCTTTGPLFTPKDIERLAKYLRLSQQAFIAKYLRIDEDGDHVLQQVPCAFLGSDNYCSVYDVRPKACREYPHTDREKQTQLFNLTKKNAVICPAVEQILQRIDQRLTK